ncbi:thioredoxin family protein [Luteimonas gilva]|uniref:Thioredoxin family protein n=1 Tax=Luteimonas gilva TaxID=2572684 RepID=A0A4U5JTD8_9GAMM|nr:thioredoxin family protein [Luteimonas gilva]TKR29639.1 thioredoxin family protein [Luteimonas gilva]
MKKTARGVRWTPLILGLALAAGCGSEQKSAQNAAPAPSAPAVVQAEKVLAADFDPRRDPADDLRTATLAAQREGKRIVLDVGGDWCAWCRRMDAFVENDASVRAYRDAHFVWMKVNYSEENENVTFLSKFPKAKGYPHLFVLDADGKLLHSQFTGALEQGKGYDRDKFLAFLKRWAPAQS